MANREIVRTERQVVTASDFAAEMQRLDQSAESTNIMIYGDSNAGKTVVAGTAPGRCLWLAGEPGFKSAARAAPRAYVRRIPDTATALAAIEWLRQNDRFRKLDWIILDGATTMDKRFRLGYAQEAYDLNPAKRVHRNLPDKPDYFNTQNFWTSWIPLLVDMQVNLLVTAHAFRTDKTENGELLVFPGFQGKVNEISNSISGLMDVTGYYEARRFKSKKTGESKVIRRMYFEPPEREDVHYVCGDKFDALGPYMDFPTIPEMMARINGEESE